LLAQYEERGVDAIQATVTSEKAFDNLRQGMASALERWKSARRRVHAVFLLELAEHGLTHGWYYWVDVLDLARRFVVSRPDVPGRNPDEDDFELLWHKTSLALLEWSRRPELVEDCGVAPLRSRLSASKAAIGEPRLVDPWIALTAGIADELWTIFDPSLLASRGASAMRAFDEAAADPHTATEALVRQSRLLIRGRRYEDALTTLERAGDPTADVFVRYWSRLFRGAALDGVGDARGAAEAYAAALDVAPHAQSALAALMALSFRRDDLEVAYADRDAIKTSTDTIDPWWEYGYGDRRFLEARLQRLRMSSR
jgi:hypothetical protein